MTFPLLALAASPLRAADEDPLARYDGFLVTSVDVAGYQVTKPFVIRREIRAQVGDDFSAATVAADLTRIENLGIFSSQWVTVTPTDSTVALVYQVREMPWIVPYPIVAYTEVDGFSAGAGVASVNMLGRSIILAAAGTVGGVDAFSLAFTHPWITGNHIGVSAVLSDDRRFDPLNDFREHSREITPWVGRWVGDAGRVAATVGWFQMNADRDGITVSPDRRDDFLRFGIRGGIDTRNSWRNPCNGWNNELALMWIEGLGAGESSWPLLEVDLRRYQPVFGYRNALIVGALLSWQDGQAGTEVPGYLQYRMGGANSIRGYDIGVLGRELYGKNQFIATVEYQHQLIRLREFRYNKWSVSAGLDLAVFMDLGNAWNLAPGFNTANSRRGFGVGLRFLVPAVNEIRTDVAVGEDGEVFFHLGVGEKLSAQRNRLR